MWSLDNLFGQSPILMDGGLGTTLEDELGATVTQSPIWSAYPIANNPEAVVKSHLRFLEAGARIILTATYQCSFDSLHRAGFDEAEARLLMSKGVQLADEARARFQAQVSDAGHITQKRSIFIALSLGPLGATLKPTQEFEGCYPPPYGPRGFVTGGLNENAFENPHDEILAIDALARFHFDRLLVFAADHRTWDLIDCIAFETVPLRREVKAIRKAMGWLQRKFTEDGATQALKPWWISCVFPFNGDSPENLVSGGKKAPMDGFLEAAYQDDSIDTSILLKPSGFGINCTELKYIPALVDKVRHYFQAQETWPYWLVLYPNGNDTYDKAKQAWIEAEDDHGEEWAKELISIIEKSMVITSQRLVLGGCCRTGPKEISTLARHLEKTEHITRTFSLANNFRQCQ
ncbi:Homocysteine S-methyltransferase [Pholiota conissans]|uniref:Homocysteine S-methyltransferase n=1 Tax=Pholiota conissans TaxID=109636 RepID=A0A9P5YZJ7_9AGAR|nr:Homocysteine S-methyltransferase [Pholiota conissans]